ncbi:MAG TPA: ABC transporter substrate-binding protein [Chloroflexota bacterium]|jgi:ABC-type nitrate/sulfonate/bicarbonate transport system substrate-binding protein|nr:ABC transporter substrate-binding protein [Chloroflexota bacterium]
MHRWVGLPLVLGLLVTACAPAAAPPAPSPPAPTTSREAAAPAPSPAPLTLEVAVPALTALPWPFVVVRDGPIGAQYGIRLDWIVTETDARSAQALLGGSVDFAEAAMDAVARAVDQGGDIVAIGGNMNRPPYALAVRATIQRWEDVRGKKLAVPDLRGGSTILLKLLLGAHGIHEEDYDLQPLGGTPNRYAALANGVVDGAILGQPADFRASDEGYRILGYTSDLDYQFTTYAVRRSAAAQNREKTVRFLRAMAAAHRWLHDPANRAEAIALGSAALHTSPEELGRTWDLYFGQNPGRVVPLNAELNLSGVETVVRVLAEQGELHDASGLPRFVDTSYLDEALRGG